MTRWLFIFSLLTAWLCLRAQTNETLTVDDLLNMGQQYLEENVDEKVLDQLGQIDQTKVQELLKQLQDTLDQDYVLDLAALKDAASAGLTLLASSPDTEPYAEWLRPRLDYFDTALDLDQGIAPPRPTPAQPEPRKPAPTTKQKSKAWATTVKSRPRPAGAAQYEAKLKAIFQRHGVPKELFWLAEVESGFNPKAQSPAGAVGLYQLMPATAKSLGLATWPLDERKNAEKSADAAARHLRALHKQFNDWPLAIAAYNAGAGRVKSKLDAKKPKSFDDIAHKLPSETQMYVPKLNAILQLREGKSLEQLGKS
jgi:membrane-bound lytic murein transglycosylase D